jgi:hypothetical protein
MLFKIQVEKVALPAALPPEQVQHAAHPLLFHTTRVH